MHANLVCPACFKAKTKVAYCAKALENSVIGSRLAYTDAHGLINSHFLAVHGMPSDRQIHVPLVLGEAALNKSSVLSDNAVVLQLRG